MSFIDQNSSNTSLLFLNVHLKLILALKNYNFKSSVTLFMPVKKLHSAPLSKGVTLFHACAPVYGGNVI